VLPGKRGTPDGSAAAFSPVAQRINQLFWLTNFAVTNDAFARGMPTSGASTSRLLPGQRHDQHPILLNMNARLPCFESHASRSPYRPSG
jgi:hypothetical protein